MIWIARDDKSKCNLCLFTEVPPRVGDGHVWMCASSTSKSISIPDELYPEVTYENSPQQLIASGTGKALKCGNVTIEYSPIVEIQTTDDLPPGSTCTVVTSTFESEPNSDSISIECKVVDHMLDCSECPFSRYYCDGIVCNLIAKE